MVIRSAEMRAVLCCSGGALPLVWRSDNCGAQSAARRAQSTEHTADCV